jgi:hypothetical protein
MSSARTLIDSLYSEFPRTSRRRLIKYNLLIGLDTTYGEALTVIPSCLIFYPEFGAMSGILMNEFKSVLMKMRGNLMDASFMEKTIKR